MKAHFILTNQTLISIFELRFILYLDKIKLCNKFFTVKLNHVSFFCPNPIFVSSNKGLMS